MFDHVDFAEYARWHHAAADRLFAEGRIASALARREQARRCEREAAKRAEG